MPAEKPQEREIWCDSFDTEAVLAKKMLFVADSFDTETILASGGMLELRGFGSRKRDADPGSLSHYPTAALPPFGAVGQGPGLRVPLHSELGRKAGVALRRTGFCCALCI